MSNSTTQPPRLRDLPLWRLLVALADSERAFGPPIRQHDALSTLCGNGSVKVKPATLFGRRPAPMPDSTAADPDGEPLDTFTILTTDANATVAPTHDRMPVIVEPTNYTTWLDATKSADGSLLRPYPAEAMTVTAVSSYVNDAKHQGPECIAAGGW
jgi:hypothetical protein